MSEDHQGVLPFAALLKRLRIAAGLTQEALAVRAGLSTRGVSDLERGLHPAPQRETVRRLAGALGLDPGDATRLAATAARSGRTPSAPGMGAGGDDVPGAALPSPLTPPLTTLIGRELEVAALRTLIDQPEVRLVTLTGPAGVGKTRLALRIVEDVGAALDGVVVVPLTPIRDPALVLPAVARAVGIREGGGQPLPGSLLAALRRKRLLLVLDNFEQVSGRRGRCWIYSSPALA